MGYESRLEKYRNTMTLFVTNVEENIEQNIDEELLISMKIMRSRALMEANTSNRSLRHLESVRHKNKTIQSNMNNLLTITSLRSTLEELVNYATPSVSKYKAKRASIANGAL